MALVHPARETPESAPDAVVKAQGGDHAALFDLIREHEDGVYNLVLSIVRNADDAHDLTQDVWLRVIKRLPELRQPERFVPWLYRIARNRSLDFVRSRKSQDTATNPIPAGSLQDEFDPPDPHGATPEQHVLSLDERRKVWEALGGLSERDRVALFLREERDLPYEEIAEILGISQNAAQVRVCRARERFRQQFTRVDADVHGCHVSLLKLSALVDDALSASDTIWVQRHVRGCGPCEDRVSSMRTGRELYRELAGGQAPPGLLLAILAKLQLSLGGVAGLTAGGVAAGSGIASGLGAKLATLVIAVVAAVVAAAPGITPPPSPIGPGALSAGPPKQTLVPEATGMAYASTEDGDDSQIVAAAVSLSAPTPSPPSSSTPELERAPLPLPSQSRISPPIETAPDAATPGSPAPAIDIGPAAAADPVAEPPPAPRSPGSAGQDGGGALVTLVEDTGAVVEQVLDTGVQLLDDVTSDVIGTLESVPVLEPVLPLAEVVVDGTLAVVEQTVAVVPDVVAAASAVVEPVDEVLSASATAAETTVDGLLDSLGGRR